MTYKRLTLHQPRLACRCQLVEIMLTYLSSISPVSPLLGATSVPCGRSWFGVHKNAVQHGVVPHNGGVASTNLTTRFFFVSNALITIFQHYQHCINPTARPTKQEETAWSFSPDGSSLGPS